MKHALFKKHSIINRRHSRADKTDKKIEFSSKTSISRKVLKMVRLSHLTVGSVYHQLQVAIW